MLPWRPKGKELLYQIKRLLNVRWASEGGSAEIAVEDCCPFETFPPGPQFSFSPCVHQPRVIIVGAGMAGLSAAARLATAGIDNFLVLEAKERPGGRIHSCMLGDEVAELGAEWIEGGSPANPIYSLACTGGLLSCEGSAISAATDDPPVYLTSDGRAIETETAEQGVKLYEKIRDQADSLFSLSCETKQTLKKFMAHRLQQELIDIPEELRFDISRVVQSHICGLRSRWGADAEEMSADEYGSSLSIPGTPLWISKGMINILCPILEDIPDENIMFCKPVKNIDWGDTSAIQVTCCDGECFTADYCIVTVSLGVLKKHANELFCPELPDEKLEAIDRLGFGCVNKIFLEYETGFWGRREGRMRFSWTFEEMEKCKQWSRGISSIQEMATSRDILIATVAGKEALVMEKLDEEKVAEDLTYLVRRFTGDIGVPYPVRLMRSMWGSEHWTLGSGSYMGKCSRVADQCQLGAPVPEGGPRGGPAPRLLFAGEATAPGRAATLLGARLSGLREAERVLALTEAYHGPPPPFEQPFRP